MDMKIVPYAPRFENDIRLLDDNSVQGNRVKIRMNKPTIHSRAEVFEDHHTILAKSDNDIVGYMTGAKTVLRINDTDHEVFVGFDAKVRSDQRNKGVFKTLTTHLFEYYAGRGIKYGMITTKSNNKSIRSIVFNQFIKSWSIGFVYLTLPTSRHLKHLKPGKGPKLSIGCVDPGVEQEREYCRIFDGFKIFNTYKLYQLQILEIPFFLRKGIRAANWFFGTPRYPTTDRPMKIASLYDIHNLQVGEFNAAMRELQSEGIEYLNVCCTKGDYVYNTLKPLSIFRYDYNLVATLELDPKDQIKFDVRCL